MCVWCICAWAYMWRERESDVMLFVECDERWDCVCDV